jgi:hypothetical protein
LRFGGAPSRPGPPGPPSRTTILSLTP